MQLAQCNLAAASSHCWHLTAAGVDEEEDDARWSKLIEETDKLIEETEEMEAAHGKILMENKLSDMELKKEEIEDAPFWKRHRKEEFYSVKPDELIVRLYYFLKLKKLSKEKSG